LPWGFPPRLRHHGRKVVIFGGGKIIFANRCLPNLLSEWLQPGESWGKAKNQEVLGYKEKNFLTKGAEGEKHFFPEIKYR
jgi:hypothetical protein